MLQTMDNYTLIKDYFRLFIVLHGEQKHQGHLELHEICHNIREQIFRWVVDNARNTICNHKFRNATVYPLPRNLFIVETGDYPVVESEDHETITLKPNSFYIAYHPIPTID